MKQILFVALIATILVGCNKSGGNTPPPPSKPGMGTTWTYRYTKFTAIGDISARYNITYKVTTEQTVNGVKWYGVTDSVGNIVRMLGVKSDGLYQIINNNPYLLCKDPAAVGDSYIGRNENGDITYTVKQVGVEIGTQGAGDQTVNRYEGIVNGLTKDMIWYNPTAWIVKEDFYGVNPFTMVNYVMSRIELVSTKY